VGDHLYLPTALLSGKELLEPHISSRRFGAPKNLLPLPKMQQRLLSRQACSLQPNYHAGYTAVIVQPKHML
jgi:hypothetical protein